MFQLAPLCSLRAFLGSFGLLFVFAGIGFLGCSQCESNVPLYVATPGFTRRLFPRGARQQNGIREICDFFDFSYGVYSRKIAR
jgi:hypothetical protein